MMSIPQREVLLRHVSALGRNRSRCTLAPGLNKSTDICTLPKSLTSACANIGPAASADR